MKIEDLIAKSEKELLEDTIYYPYISSLLKYRQFSEDFLSKTIYYYNSWDCLKYQKNLTPYFCFYYLFDNNTDNSDNWTSYNDIEYYFQQYNPLITKDELEIIYKKAINDRNIKS
jgi:hypothetical protein